MSQLDINISRSRTFKFFRMVAIYRVLTHISESPPPVRSWVPNLMLGASCIYMFNALIYRPCDDRAEQALAEECALWVYSTHNPAAEENEGLDLIEEPNMVPCTTTRGLYFLSAIVQDEGQGHIRLPRARLLDRALLARLYGFSMLADVFKALGGGLLGLSARSTANKKRTANKKVTVRITAFQSQLTLHDFDFAAQGIQPHCSMAMTGLDAPMNRFHEEDIEQTLDRQFSELWAQFPSDLIQCSPNHRNRNDPAYVHLTMEERHNVTVDLFKSFALPFDAVYIRTCQDTAQWRALFFDKFFPHPGTALSSTLQNFRNCTYLNAYSAALERLKRGDMPQVRAALWEQFNELRWLPHAESDRMWPTRPRQPSHLWTTLPSTHTGPAVNIVVNPRFYPGPRCIHLADHAPPPHRNLAEEDDHFAEVYNRVLVRQSNRDLEGLDHSSLRGGSELLESIRRDRDNSHRRSLTREESSPAPAAFARRAHTTATPRPQEEEESSPAPAASRRAHTTATPHPQEEEESSPAPAAFARRAHTTATPRPQEEEESSPAPQTIASRLRGGATGDIKEESSCDLTSPKIPRAAVNTAPSLFQLIRGQKRPACPEAPGLSSSTRNVRPRTDTSLPTSFSTSQELPNPVTASEFKSSTWSDGDDEAGEFKSSTWSDDDDEAGEFKSSTWSDDDDEAGEFKSSTWYDDAGELETLG